MYSEKEAERISRDAHRDEREARGGIGAALRESIAMGSGAEGGVFRLWMNLLTVALGFVFGRRISFGTRSRFGSAVLGIYCLCRSRARLAIARQSRGHFRPDSSPCRVFARHNLGQ